MSQSGLRYNNPSVQTNTAPRTALAASQAASQGVPQYYVDYYIYVVLFGNMAPGVQSTQNIQIQADSDFEWIEATCFGNLHGGAAPFLDSILMPITVQIQDGGSGRQLFSAPAPITSIAGNGKQPFILPESRVFKSRTNIQLTGVNIDAANTYDNVYLNLIGRKIFQFGGANR